MTTDAPEKLDESVDDGSSLQKRIEHLDKDDPNYASKRDKLLARLDELKKELNKMRRQIKKQQKKPEKLFHLCAQKPLMPLQMRHFLS